MRDAVIVVIAVALGGCSSQNRAPADGMGGVAGLGGAIGSSGAASAGRATSPDGGGGVTGSAGTSGSAASGAGSSGGLGSGGSPGISGNAGTSMAGSFALAGASGSAGMAVDGGSPSSGGADAAGASGSPTSGGMGGASAAGAAGTAPSVGGSAGSGPTCMAAQSAPAAGDSTVTVQHGGRARKYRLHVPAGLAAGKPLALVLDLHGAGGDGSQQKGMSGFSALSDQEKFLVVFPDGVDGYWNVDDKCCGTAGKEKVDDVGFLRAIITKLSGEACIDGARIYVTGFSNGGGLAHRMGCDAADVVAAIAPTATDLRTDPCNPSRPISMMEVKGMADSLEPYEGGLVGPEGGQYVAVGAKASLALWADINGCSGTATELDQYCETFTQCSGGVETDLCSLPNVDHSPYSNSLGFNVAKVIWKMFERQPIR